MADDFGMGATAQNVSPWVTHKTNSRLLEAQLKYATLDKLLKEASSLAPDTQKLSEDILKYKTSAGDKAKFSGELNGLMNNYLTKYQENPFYAFSREGKESARQMQRLANHPMLGTLEAMNEKAQKLYDDVTKSGNASKVNVKNGLINVYDHSKQKFDWINPDNIDYNTQEVLTAGDAITKKLEKGFYDPSNPYKLDDLPEVTMSSYDNVLTNINKILEGTGAVSKEALSSDIEGLQSQLTETTKSNLPNIQMKAKAIFSKAGLPPDYWDTLLSNVYSSYRNSGSTLPTSREATAEVFNSVNNIINSRLRESEDISGAGKKGASGAAGKDVKTDVGQYEAFIMGEIGTDSQIQYGLDPKTGTPLAGLGNTSGTFFDYKENNIPSGSLPLTMNPVFKAFVPPNEQLTTLDGKILNKGLVVPDVSSGASLVRVSDTEAYLVFDAYVEEEAGEDISKSGKELTDSEETYMVNLEKTLGKLSEDNPLYIYAPSSWTFDGDYYKVKVRARVDPNYAQSQARTSLDKNSYKMSQSGVDLSGGVPKSTSLNRVPYTNK